MKLYNLLDKLHICTTNKRRIVSIKEDKAKALFEKCTSNGCIIFSPNMADEVDNDAQQLANLIIELTQKIKERGFCYTPIYGCFADESEEVCHKYGFVIYPFDNSGNKKPFEALQEFVCELSKTYNQKNFLIKTPNGEWFYNNTAENITPKLNENISFASIIKEYFSSTNRDGKFKYVDTFLNAGPDSLAGAHVRWCKGEKFIPYK